MGFISSIDFAILEFIQNTMKCALFDFSMMIFSYLGEAGAVWILIGLIFLSFRKTRATGVIMLAAMLFGYLVGELGIKNLIVRPRPFLLNTDVTLNIIAPSGYSFPSGHSTSSFAAALVIFVREKRWMGICAYTLAGLIAFSRLYNYVHYPSDVLCGIILGTLSAILMIFIFRKTGLDKMLSSEIRLK